jgi:hypothetical protein
MKIQVIGVNKGDFGYHKHNDKKNKEQTNNEFIGVHRRSKKI